MFCNMMKFIVFMLLVAVVGGSINPPLDIDHKVVVQMFEWKYPDIGHECENFLSPKGFGGVQVSPPSENLVSSERPWWERYQPVSYKINSRSGNKQRLEHMINKCNKVGIRVIMDIVINHMTGSVDDCHGTAGSSCDPEKLSYPAVPYTVKDFHYPECELINWKNISEIRNCKLLGLHDLNQTKEHVRQKIVDYMNHLIHMGVGGFRIDAARHMYPSDLKVIYGRLDDLNTSHGFPPNTAPLMLQEVSGLEDTGEYQQFTPIGLVTDMRYGNELGRCFQGWNDLRWLKNFGPAWNLVPGNQSNVFIENHDLERTDLPNFLNYKKSQSYKMAIAFMLAWGYGSPTILSSYKFSDYNEGPPHNSNWATLSPRPIKNDVCSNNWVCQHRWHQIYNMVNFHNVVNGTNISNWWDNGRNQIAFSRGNKGFIAFNLESYQMNQTLQTGLPKGSYCDIISGNLVDNKCTGNTLNVNDGGTAQIIISKYDANSTDDSFVAIHTEASRKTGQRG